MFVTLLENEYRMRRRPGYREEQELEQWTEYFRCAIPIIARAKTGGRTEEYLRAVSKDLETSVTGETLFEQDEKKYRKDIERYCHRPVFSTMREYLYNFCLMTLDPNAVVIDHDAGCEKTLLDVFVEEVGYYA